MNKYLKYLLSACIPFLLFTCKEKEIDFLNDGNPRIVSISLPGIPQEDISIDQKNQLITVKVPPVLPENLIADLKLTPNAECRLDVNWSNFFFWDFIEFDVTNVGDDRDYPAHFTRYRLKAVAKSALKLGDIAAPIEYVLSNGNDESIYLPAINLYGNPLPFQVRFTELQTGNIVRLDSTVSTLFKPINRGIGEHLNYLNIDVGAQRNLLPGTYNIELVMPDGSVLKVQQPLIVKMGRARLDYPRVYFGFEWIAGQKAILSGTNLFEGHLAMELEDKAGKVTRLDKVEFTKTGHKLEINIEKNLQVGQYVLRLIQDEASLELCYKVNIRKDNEDVTYIGTIGDEIVPCSLITPISVKRSEKIFFTYFLADKGTPRLRLNSVENTKLAYYGTVKPYHQDQGYQPPTVTLPKAMKIGLYEATLEVVDDKGELVAESHSYPQLLRVD